MVLRGIMVLAGIMFLSALIGRLGDSAVGATLAAHILGPRSNWSVGPVRCFHPARAARNSSSMISSAGALATDSSGSGGGVAQSAAIVAKTSFQATGALEGARRRYSSAAVWKPRRQWLIFSAILAPQGRARAFCV